MSEKARLSKVEQIIDCATKLRQHMSVSRSHEIRMENAFKHLSAQHSDATQRRLRTRLYEIQKELGARFMLLTVASVGICSISRSKERDIKGLKQASEDLRIQELLRLDFWIQLEERFQPLFRDAVPHNIPETKVSLDDTDVNHIKTYLSQQTDFRDQPLFRVIQSCSWSSILDLTEEVAEVWTSSCGTIPVLCDVSDCWQPHPPSEAQVLANCFEQISSKDVVAYGRNGSDMNKYAAMATRFASRQDPINTSVILDIPWEGEQTFHLPEEIRQRFCQNPDLIVHCNSSSRNHLVSLHIDEGDEVVSFTAGRARRLWMLFPSNKHNNELLIPSGGMRCHIEGLLPKLQHGMLTCPKPGAAQWFGSTTWHATVAIVEGELFTVSFRAPERIRYVAKNIAMHAPGATLSQPDLTIREFENLVWCLEVISEQPVLQNMVPTAMEAWIEIWSIGSKIFHTNKKGCELVQRAEELWARILERNGADARIACGCETGEVSYARHFLDAHMIMPNHATTRRKRKRHHNLSAS